MNLETCLLMNQCLMAFSDQMHVKAAGDHHGHDIIETLCEDHV